MNQHTIDDVLYYNRKSKLARIETFEDKRNAAVMLRKIFSIIKSDRSSQFINEQYEEHLKLNNGRQRKEQLKEIMNENFKMLSRINNQKPSLDFQKLEKNRKEQEKVISNMSKYPHIFKVKGNVVKSQMQSPVNHQHRMLLNEEEMIRHIKLQNVQSQKNIVPYKPFDHNRHYVMNKVASEQRLRQVDQSPLQDISSEKKKKTKYIPLLFKDDQELPLNRKVVYQELLTLNNNKKYVIEISYSKVKQWIVAARNSDHFKLEFPRKQAKKIKMELGGTNRAFALQVRISSTNILYIQDLNKLLYYERKSSFGEEKQLNSFNNITDQTHNSSVESIVYKKPEPNFQTPMQKVKFLDKVKLISRNKQRALKKKKMLKTQAKQALKPIEDSEHDENESIHQDTMNESNIEQEPSRPQLQ